MMMMPTTVMGTTMGGQSTYTVVVVVVDCFGLTSFSEIRIPRRSKYDAFGAQYQ